MTEFHANVSGDVSSECQCDPGLTTDAATGIPTWCFNPQGDCQFAQACLGARYGTCSGLQTDDMREHCQWFTDNLYTYSNCSTRAWVREMRHCFQVYYLDYLDSQASVTCQDLSTNYYYQSFDYCLRKTTSSGSDFCSLQNSDKSSIYSSLNTLFASNLKNNINTVLSWMENC